MIVVKKIPLIRIRLYFLGDIFCHELIFNSKLFLIIRMKICEYIQFEINNKSRSFSTVLRLVHYKKKKCYVKDLVNILFHYESNNLND